VKYNARFIQILYKEYPKCILSKPPIKTWESNIISKAFGEVYIISFCNGVNSTDDEYGSYFWYRICTPEDRRNVGKPRLKWLEGRMISESITWSDGGGNKWVILVKRHRAKHIQPHQQTWTLHFNQISSDKKDKILILTRLLFVSYDIWGKVKKKK
jgi:hypothetical protein